LIERVESRVWTLHIELQLPTRGDGEIHDMLGALIGFAENDQATQRSVAAFLKGLADLGWVPDRDLTINFRYGAGDADRIEPSRRNWVASSPM
jgi:hypothetical protein